MSPRFAILPALFFAALALLPEGGVEARPAASFAEVGRFYMQSFAPEDYGAHPQNWAMAQDDRGFIYVANGDGVLEYDGVSWRLIPTANRSTVRSLAVGPEGRVYVGAVGELGFLAPDEEGRLRYVSLAPHVPEEERDFSDVWRAYALSDGVYFQSRERLFRWRDGGIEVWRAERGFFNSFAVHDVFYVVDRTGELFSMDRDTLRPVPGGALFAGRHVFALVPHGEGSFLAVTSKNGLMRCRRAGMAERLACAAYGPGLRQRLARLDPYCAVLLPGEILAVGTRRGGVVLIDRDAQLIRVLNEASGLRSDIVWSVHVDRQGGLWLALDDGLARVDVSASLSFFDATTGLPGAVETVVRHRGRLYAATAWGVSVLNPAAGTVPRFVSVLDVAEFCWSLVSTAEGLLAGCVEGVYNVDLGRRIWEVPRGDVFSLHRSRHDPTQLYLAFEDGLARLVLDAGTWRDGGRFEAVRGQVRTIAEDDQGRLWLGTRTQGVLRVEAGASPSDVEAVRRFGVDDGLPVGWLDTATVAGQVRVLSFTGDGVFQFDSEAGSGRFVPDLTFPVQGSVVEALAEDDRGRVWLAAGQDSGVAHPDAEGGITYEPTALRQIPHLNPLRIVAEPGGPVWIAGHRELVRLDPESTLETESDFPVWLRRVTAADGSTLYDGPHGRGAEAPEWPFEKNALRFAYAAPRFATPEHTRYRTFLEGFDEGWSTWSPETYKDYTNLWEGRYVFRVEARDVYGFVSREDRFAFRVLPPWYRTWWAYGLYGLALTAVVLAFVRFQRRKLWRERAVSARLREVDKLKDEFLANTSHELRTPLYGIIGLAEAMQSAGDDLPASYRDQLANIVASGHRLERLVGDILDFSSLQEGRDELVGKLTATREEATSGGSGVDAAAHGEKGTVELRQSSGPERILVVDDEPVNRMVFRRQLETAGYEVQEAADGFQALEKLEDVDLVLLDVMMPQMSGYEVCEKLRERFSPAELPVVFITARSLPEDVGEGFAVGGNDYLVKPVGMGELLARIRIQLEVLTGYRQLQRLVGERGSRAEG